MKFEIKNLRKLLYSVKQNNIDQINIKSHQFELIINQSIISNKKILTKTKEISNINLKKHKSIESNNSIPKTKISNNESETYSTIVSPMVGTFYRSPAPNESAFIEQYDFVQKKQTVCIIEAMKLMNEIEAEVNGEIVDILVNDGDIVDCGQALMKVKTL
uniref:Biotin carboxyl carrier protein of acetyl-CoA carboxylase n=1 Tax=Schimmelmannia schousboei TaxID=173468 RepID=A0A1C9C8J2_9FLOR|nr:acetyl-CoA carboxylase biotin carboxyl carrier protein [Schimmelmannia schousboei]AOM64689.1 acetyl-CoA carboxylase biotin carboxyl carrier protein [Schimmelmannia schousboei]